MSANAFSIGDKVRVNSLHNRISKIAMIASYNSDFTYDVFYDTRTDDGRRESEAEEISVEPTRIAKLQAFEIVSLSQLSSSQKKDYGNIMFKLQDLDSATRYYKSALNSLLLNEKVSFRCNTLECFLDDSDALDIHICHKYLEVIVYKVISCHQWFYFVIRSTNMCSAFIMFLSLGSVHMKAHGSIIISHLIRWHPLFYYLLLLDSSTRLHLLLKDLSRVTCSRPEQENRNT